MFLYTGLNGGGGANLDAQDEPDAIIPFFPKTKETIYQRCAPLYEKGHSLREIAAMTGIPKSTIRETLKRRGLERRKFSAGSDVNSEKPKGKRPGATPYGYGWLEAELVKDPKEYSVVIRILKMWQEGKGVTSITQKLNKDGIQSRSGKNWTKSVVSSILSRENKSEGIELSYGRTD